MSIRHSSCIVALVSTVFALLSAPQNSIAKDPWVVYEGATGSGQGKHIVLVSGDEEYRSEEALPQLGKILANHHGFKCTVLFAVDPASGYINPNNRNNIPGLAALDNADLAIIFLRRRELPDASMQYIDNYLMTGKPVIGIRTATHSFQLNPESKFVHYSDEYHGDKKEWDNGFGRFVLGESWINHHGKHKHESTRGLIAPGAASHPILRGIKDGDVWGPTDVYGVRLPLPGDSQPLVLGQVMKRKGEFDKSDRLYGMRPEDGPPVEGAKNDPMMPIAWTKSYQLPGGTRGRAFTSTIGASTDLLSEGTRRLLANAALWAVGFEDKIPPEGANVEIVGTFEPTKFEFRDDDYWKKTQMSIDDHR
jgi:hypothetical protein